MCVQFGELLTPTARKPHRCEWCFGRIPKGEKHTQFKGMWEHEWQNWRMHDECYEVQAQEDSCEGFAPGAGEMPERVRQLVSVE